MTSNKSAPGQIAAYEVFGTHYPVIDMKQGMINSKLNKLRRALGGLNPFAIQQIPSQDRIALGIRYGNKFYAPDPYVNSTFFTRTYSGHYDPLASMKNTQTPFQKGDKGPGSGMIPSIKVDKLPRGCVRMIQNYKRCQMINEDCNDEANDIVNVCPNWALQSLKEKKRQIIKFTAININRYKRALEVSSYNEGKTVADLERHSWKDGTRENLRPDTMWADERYLNITQKDINEAKERIQKRNEEKGVKATELKEQHHYDWKGLKERDTNPLLYP